VGGSSGVGQGGGEQGGTKGDRKGGGEGARLHESRSLTEKDGGDFSLVNYTQQIQQQRSRQQQQLSTPPRSPLKAGAGLPHSVHSFPTLSSLPHTPSSAGPLGGGGGTPGEVLSNEQGWERRRRGRPDDGRCVCTCVCECVRVCVCVSVDTGVEVGLFAHV
jgi:hypothetical protein